MSTKVCDRKDSPVQFIETAKELCKHTLHYSHKLLKSTRFTIQTRLCDLSFNILETLVKANSIFCRKDNEEDIEYKRKLLIDSLGLLNCLEVDLDVVFKTCGDQINTYGWEQWGCLISTERKLINGLIKTLNNPST